MKRSRQTEKNQQRNAALKSRVRTATKSVLAAVNGGSKDEAQTALALAVPRLDKAAGKGVLPKKTISRKISRLTKKVNALKLTTPKE